MFSCVLLGYSQFTLSLLEYSLLRLRPSSLPLLVSVFHYLTVLASSEVGVALLSADWLERLLPVLSANMSSPYSPVGSGRGYMVCGGGVT